METENLNILTVIGVWWLIGFVTFFGTLFFKREKEKLKTVLKVAFYGPIIPLIGLIMLAVYLWMVKVPESIKEKIATFFNYINIFKLLDMEIGRSDSDKNK